MTTEFPGQVPSSTPTDGQVPEVVDDRDDEIARLQAEIARRTDPKALKLAELRRQLAELDAPEVKPAEPIVVRPDGLVGPAHTTWDDIPKAGEIPLSEVADPVVREILSRLRNAEKENARLIRLLATQGAPSNDAAPAGNAILHLANGRVVKHATSIPTHHFDAIEDGGDGKLHKVLSGHFEQDNDAPSAE